MFGKYIIARIDSLKQSQPNAIEIGIARPVQTDFYPLRTLLVL